MGTGIRQILGYSLMGVGVLVGGGSPSAYFNPFLLAGAALFGAGLVVLLIDDRLRARERKVSDASNRPARRP